jgi:hypothetical protein
MSLNSSFSLYPEAQLNDFSTSGLIKFSLQDE